MEGLWYNDKELRTPLLPKACMLFVTDSRLFGEGRDVLCGTDDVKKLCRGNIHKSIDGKNMTEADVRQWLNLSI